MTERIELGLTGAAAGGAPGCACCATSVDGASNETTSSAPVAEEILVSGMTCSHCVSSVTEELTAIEGVEGVTVDLAAGGASRVLIHSAAPLDPDAVRAAVEEAGYALAARPA